MNQSLTYLLTHLDTLTKEDESYITQKIQSEPFVQGWKIIQAKIQKKKDSNFGYFQSNNFFANTLFKNEIPDDVQAVINLGTSKEVKTIYLESNEEDFNTEKLKEIKENTTISTINEENMNDINSSESNKKSSFIKDEYEFIEQTKANKSRTKKNKNKKRKIKFESIGSSEFTKWLLSLEPLESKNPIRKKKKRKKEHRLAKSSVTKKKSVISEPLADLLIDQGHTNEGIEMYRQLSLVFPEKSAYFAAKILEINNLK